MWALGIILFNMMYGRCPFRAETERELYRKISKGSYGYPDEVYANHEEYRGMKVSKEFKTLVKKMLMVNADQRLTCAEILNNEWFKSS